MATSRKDATATQNLYITIGELKSGQQACKDTLAKQDEKLELLPKIFEQTQKTNGQVLLHTEQIKENNDSLKIVQDDLAPIKEDWTKFKGFWGILTIVSSIFSCTAATIIGIIIQHFWK